MYLSEICADALRNFDQFRIEPGPGINLIFGENASGKTSVLEAIYFLSRVKSFRTNKSIDVLKNGRQQFVVTGTLETDHSKIAIGVEKSCANTRIKVNGEIARSRAEQAMRLPLLVILPDSGYLFTGTPKDRRHWLDWSLFHVKPAFLDTWKTYHKALRHRNAALKKTGVAQNASLLSWERAMCQEAHIIDKDRRDYIEKLEGGMKKTILTLLTGEARIRYQRGWEDDCPLEECLLNQRDADQTRGFTQSGPHRANIAFYLNELEAGKILSRGHMKLYIAALIVSQYDHIQLETGRKPIILIDDIDTELDRASQERLFGVLNQLRAQIFITSLDSTVTQFQQNQDYAVFHVKHEGVAKVVK